MKSLFLALCRQALPQSIARRLPRKVKVVEIEARESRLLNSRFLKKSMAANVLSFRYGKEYGEILICPKIIRREAKEQGNTYKYQMTWMVLHGMIHLAGVHHDRSKATAKTAARLEWRTLQKLKVK